MAEMNIPGMFDTQYAIDRQMQEDAMAAGQLPLGGGMMYATSLSGDITNQGLMGLAGLMGGKPDPLMAKQQALEEVFEQFGNPQTSEDAIAIANALQQKGLYNEAMKFRDYANELKEQDIKSYEAKTKRMTAVNKSKEAPTRDEVDYIKKVNGKDVVYTKTVQWNSSTENWDFISEAPKYAPHKPTATASDMMSAAAVVVNDDGSVGCNLDDPDCYMKAMDIYHATVVKEDAFDKEFGKVAGADVSKRYSDAKASTETITTIDASFNALNSGDPIVGFASDMRLGLAKMIGAVTGNDTKDVQATEVWLATTGKLVAELLGSGAFGSGTGLSDNDVKFAKAMVGGDVTLDEGSIRRILFIRRQLENAKIKNWNETYKSFPQRVKNNVNEFYSDDQIYQAEKPWNENIVYLKAPKGHIIQENPQGETRILWPATPYDVDTITVDGQQWTIHNKNGFDITPKQGQ